MWRARSPRGWNRRVARARPRGQEPETAVAPSRVRAARRRGTPGYAGAPIVSAMVVGALALHGLGCRKSAPAHGQPSSGASSPAGADAASEVPTPPNPGGGCTARDCDAQKVACGPAGDGCGGLLQCGTQLRPRRAEAGVNLSVCGGGADAAPCMTQTCAQIGYNCGPAADGCGGLT